MSVKRVLLSLLTFGWSLHKELKSMQEQRDNLHDALHSAADEEIRSKAELKLMIKETQEAKRSYESKAPRLIPAEYYDFNDNEYLRGVSEVYNSKPFRFFMYNLQQDIMDELSSASPEMAVELQGTIKGLSFINRMLSDNENSLKALVAPQTPQEDDYV